LGFAGIGTYFLSKMFCKGSFGWGPVIVTNLDGGKIQAHP